MKYYLDTEFHEYKKKPLIGKAIDTIELISIGIVSEDELSPLVNDPDSIRPDVLKSFKKSGREYYAICNEFDLKAAWNNEGLRENVLRPIFDQYGYGSKADNPDKFFTIKGVQCILNSIGRSRKQIAEEIKEFVYNQSPEDVYNDTFKSKPEFYAYYADYDWVVFRWLFGKMIDLPEGFPMYCRDLKQMLDEKLYEGWHERSYDERVYYGKTKDDFVYNHKIEDHPDYPKQDKEHNSLSDAKWNYELYKFLEKI